LLKKYCRGIKYCRDEMFQGSNKGALKMSSLIAGRLQMPNVGISLNQMKTKLRPYTKKILFLMKENNNYK
jgi:hypothetical protein